MTSSASASTGDPLRPWRVEFLSYLETIEAAPPAGMSTIQWWGVSVIPVGPQEVADNDLSKINAQRYPVWASLARDYLSIMAASVSSERAFSQGGITISKRRNQLKGDIVEALQCVKCAVRHELLFAEPGPSSVVEDELDDFEIGMEAGEKSGIEDEDEEEGWDTLLLDDDEDDEGNYTSDFDTVEYKNEDDD